MGWCPLIAPLCYLCTNPSRFCTADPLSQAVLCRLSVDGSSNPSSLCALCSLLTAVFFRRPAAPANVTCTSQALGPRCTLVSCDADQPTCQPLHPLEHRPKAAGPRRRRGTQVDLPPAGRAACRAFTLTPWVIDGVSGYRIKSGADSWWHTSPCALRDTRTRSPCLDLSCTCSQRPRCCSCLASAAQRPQLAPPLPPHFATRAFPLAFRQSRCALGLMDRSGTVQRQWGRVAARQRPGPSPGQAAVAARLAIALRSPFLSTGSCCERAGRRWPNGAGRRSSPLHEALVD